MTWAIAIQLLSASFDPTLTTLPDARRWEEGFAKLRQKQVQGFYYGSPIGIAPVGAYHIFEGQARFSQLQYLHHTSGGEWDWQDFERLGMLGERYVAAFNHFLRVVGEPRPQSVGDPLIGLFLVLCDLAINPTEGFPFDIHIYESFLIDVDPGSRFHLFCHGVAGQPDLKKVITDYSNEEYEQITTALCAFTRSPSPLAASRLVATWPEKNAAIDELLTEDAVFRFSTPDLLIRVFFARFVRFQTDKARNPAFFVWPGVWMGSVKATRLDPAEIRTLFQEHEALFLDVPGGEVRPRLIHNKPEIEVYETFNNFYSILVTYSLTRQWIAADGVFDFDLRWLSPTASDEEMRMWASTLFTNTYGVAPDAFVII
ncbi:MAG TPA: hypothetical protein VF584_01605 [Longimicrobium sp.]|jgi:hypothetical protein